MLRCNQKNSKTGRPCIASFNRPYNLKRHMLNQHTTLATKFIHYIPEGDAHIEYHMSSPQIAGSSKTTLTDAGRWQVPVGQQSEICHTILDPQSLTPTSSSPSSSSSLSPPSLTRDHGYPIDEDAQDDDGAEYESPSSDNSAKRKRSIAPISYDRVSRAQVNPPVPSHSPKMSTRYPNQIRASDWLSYAAKEAFEQELAACLALWGVAPLHQGTCILIPENWKGLNPLDLESWFDLDNCPNSKVPRLRYQYSDHSTAFVRAKAWFQQWPRCGTELDNYLDTGSFKPMDGSHTYHHNSCIVHIVYEPADVNDNRKECCALAKRLRQEGTSIPEHCAAHNPPCLLQVNRPLIPD